MCSCEGARKLAEAEQKIKELGAHCEFLQYSVAQHDAEVIESMLGILSDEYVYVDDLPNVGYALMIDKIKDYANKLEAGE